MPKSPKQFVLTNDIITNLRNLRSSIEENETMLYQTNIPPIITNIIELYLNNLIINTDSNNKEDKK